MALFKKLIENQSEVLRKKRLNLKKLLLELLEELRTLKEIIPGVEKSPRPLIELIGELDPEEPAHVQAELEQLQGLVRRLIWDRAELSGTLSHSVLYRRVQAAMYSIAGNGELVKADAPAAPRSKKSKRQKKKKSVPVEKYSDGELPERIKSVLPCSDVARAWQAARSNGE